MDYIKYLEKLEYYFEVYTIEVVLVMTALIAFLMLFNLFNRIKISSNTKKYKGLESLLNTPNSESMEETVLDYIKQVNLIKNSVYSLEMNQDKINEKISKSIQNVEVLRYSAFEDMGSDLSFSIALLDENLNGVVITSIYASEESNAYAKPILNGVSTYELSREEKQVVEKVANKDKENNNKDKLDS